MIYALGFVYFLYNCYQTKESPLISSIHTALVVVITHLVFNCIVNPPHVFIADIAKAVRSVLGPLFASLEKQTRVLDEVERRLKDMEARLIAQDQRLMQIEQHVRTVYDTIYATGAASGIREITKLNLGEIFDSARDGETIWLFDTFILGFFHYRENFRDAVRRGVKFRFLVISPKSKAAEDRPAEITSPPIPHPSFTSGILEYWEIIQDVAKEAPAKDNVQAKYYYGPAGVPIYLIENQRGTARRAYQSYFLLQPSVHNWHLVWVPGCGSLLNRFHEYLLWKWDFDTYDRSAA